MPSVDALTALDIDRIAGALAGQAREIERHLPDGELPELIEAALSIRLLVQRVEDQALYTLDPDSNSVWRYQLDRGRSVVTVFTDGVASDEFEAAPPLPDLN